MKVISRLNPSYHLLLYVHEPKKQQSFFLGNPQLHPDVPFRKVIQFRFVKKEYYEFLYREC